MIHWEISHCDIVKLDMQNQKIAVFAPFARLKARFYAQMRYKISRVTSDVQPFCPVCQETKSHGSRMARLVIYHCLNYKLVIRVQLVFFPLV